MNRSRLVGSRFSRLLASQPLELVPPVVLAALRAELQTLISVEAQAFSAYDAFWTFSHTSILRDRNTSWHSIFTPSNLRVLKKTERCDGNCWGAGGGGPGVHVQTRNAYGSNGIHRATQGNGTRHVLSLPQGSIHTYTYNRPCERRHDRCCSQRRPHARTTNAQLTPCPRHPFRLLCRQRLTFIARDGRVVHVRQESNTSRQRLTTTECASLNG